MRHSPTALWITGVKKERIAMQQPRLYDAGPRSPWYRILLGYHKHSGSWAWIIHRLTGIGLTVYIIVHIYAVSALQKGKEAFDMEMKLFSSPFFLFLEWALGALVVYHALNGIRIVLVDFANGAKYHKQLSFAIWTIGFVVIIAMAILIFSPYIGHQ
jgi:succinate dehydrogenase / fumarate reductase cytochrome b subunit